MFNSGPLHPYTPLPFTPEYMARHHTSFSRMTETPSYPSKACPSIIIHLIVLRTPIFLHTTNNANWRQSGSTPRTDPTGTAHALSLSTHSRSLQTFKLSVSLRRSRQIALDHSNRWSLSAERH
ncbi:hypothetical protein BDQ17DRAFT_1433850 [Cyathus striatus]|nr:hypothetical protein BDQ17DRAFT_1433850 [Cyathus striatus]